MDKLKLMEAFNMRHGLIPDKNVLLIVDAQYDFIDGTLPVPKAKHAMDLLAKELLLDHGEAYDKVVLTADWHPMDHCSFKEQGGQWPPHCIAHSAGAAIYQPIMEALYLTKTPYDLIPKGSNPQVEEYSAFKAKQIGGNCVRIIEDEWMPITVNKIHIDVVGLAYDFCVSESARQLADYGYDVCILGRYAPEIFKEGVEKADDLNFSKGVLTADKVCAGPMYDKTRVKL